jgi:hypothetical protein
LLNAAAPLRRAMAALTKLPEQGRLYVSPELVRAAIEALT